MLHDEFTIESHRAAFFALGVLCLLDPKKSKIKMAPHHTEHLFLSDLESVNRKHSALDNLR